MKKVKLKEDLIYRNLIISTNDDYKNDYITVKDSRGTLYTKIENYNHGSLTACKCYIDNMIKRGKLNG